MNLGPPSDRMVDLEFSLIKFKDKLIFNFVFMNPKFIYNILFIQEV